MGIVVLKSVRKFSMKVWLMERKRPDRNDREAAGRQETGKRSGRQR